jgi:hypothetical protein
MENEMNISPLLIPVTAILAVFSFLAVVLWSDARRREREAYYRSDMVKKVAESQGAGANVAIEFLREQERIDSRKRREGLRLAGLISTVVGIGAMSLLLGLAQDKSLGVPQAAYLGGLIPLLVGLALLVHVQALRPKG